MELGTMDLSTVGVVPERTSDPTEARRLVERDGAAIVTGLGRDSAASEQVGRDVFGDDLLALPPAVFVSDGGHKDRRPDGLSSRTRSQCHTDGYSYGRQYPDHFLLLCDRDSAVGGESFLVDGYALLDQMEADPEWAWLPIALRTVSIDQTEAGMRPLVGPLVTATDRGRHMLVMSNAVDQGPVADSDDPDRDRTMIETWRDTVYAATDHVEKFKLAPGEAVVVDNYRLFHGREPYTDEQRRMWRVWMWTTASDSGAPVGTLASDSRNARMPTASTPTDDVMV